MFYRSPHSVHKCSLIKLAQAILSLARWLCQVRELWKAFAGYVSGRPNTFAFPIFHNTNTVILELFALWVRQNRCWDNSAWPCSKWKLVFLLTCPLCCTSYNAGFVGFGQHGKQGQPEALRGGGGRRCWPAFTLACSKRKGQSTPEANIPYPRGACDALGREKHHRQSSWVRHAGQKGLRENGDRLLRGKVSGQIVTSQQRYLFRIAEGKSDCEIGWFLHPFSLRQKWRWISSPSNGLEGCQRQ